MTLFWPPTEPDEVPDPPTPQLNLRILSDVEVAFPAAVSPDPASSPLKYWSSEDRLVPSPNDPWVRLAGRLFGGGAGGIRLVPRKGIQSDLAWRWADAALRSYELKHEQKLAVVAWILESMFWAYWFDDAPPAWVVAHMDNT